MPRSEITLAREKLARIERRQAELAAAASVALSHLVRLEAASKIAKSRGKEHAPPPPLPEGASAPRRRFSRAELAAAMAQRVQGRGA